MPKRRPRGRRPPVFPSTGSPPRDLQKIDEVDSAFSEAEVRARAGGPGETEIWQEGSHYVVEIRSWGRNEVAESGVGRLALPSDAAPAGAAFAEYVQSREARGQVFVKTDWIRSQSGPRGRRGARRPSTVTVFRRSAPAES